MDSIFSALELEQLIGFFGNVAQRNNEKGKFDFVIYVGISTEETIRMIGATSKARVIALSTRAAPMSISGFIENFNKKGSSIFAKPHKFGCYLVMDPTNPLSLNSALRYWGCAIQAGAQVSGAFGLTPPNPTMALAEAVKTSFSPLPCAFIPRLEYGNNVSGMRSWCAITAKMQEICFHKVWTRAPLPSVQFHPSNKTVRLFMPGFDKSEIKLYQFRGGSELLVEAGDQRRVIRLPSQVQGKVRGAKFV